MKWGLVGVALALGLAAAMLPPLLLLALLFGAALLLAFYLEPTLALIFTLCVAPLKTLVETESAYPLPLDIGQVALGLFLGIIGLRWAVERRRALVVEWRLLLGVGLFIFSAALSLWTAYAPAQTLTELMKWTQIALLIILIPNLGRGRWLLFGLVLSAVLQALIGIWEFLGGSGAVYLWILDYRYFRAFGTFGQPNPFGGFMGMVLPVAGAFAVGSLLHGWQQPVQRRAAWLTAGLYALCGGIILLGLLSSWSRGAWLGFMGAGAVMLWLMPRQRWLGTVALSAAAAGLLLLWAVGLLPGSVTERLTGFTQDFAGIQDMRGVVISDANFAVVERLAHWQSALAMAESSPWTGVGFNNYEAAYPQFRLIDWELPLGHAHNYYLNLLAETGLIGLAGYLLMWGVVFLLSWQQLQRRLDWQQRGLMVGLWGAWVHIHLHSLIDKLYVNNLFLHLGVMFGLLAIITLREINDGSYLETA